MEIVVASQNLRHDISLAFYDGKHYVPILAKQIIENDYDVFCTQEMTKDYRKRLEELLENKYYFSGEERYGKAAKHLNECVVVMTKEKPLKTETIWLSKKPTKKGSRSYLTVFPRIATIVYLTNITIINTHLDFLLPYTKKRQLKQILNIIKKLNGHNIILTGDFNTLGNPKYFKGFKEEAAKYNLKYIEQPEKTFNGKFSAQTDHIFIPNSFELTKVWTSNEGKISDHKRITIKANY